MKLAVRKEPTTIPGGGFYYLLHPFEVKHDQEAAVFEMMGYHVIEVDDDLGKRLINNTIAAINHQVEVALLVEKFEKR